MPKRKKCTDHLSSVTVEWLNSDNQDSPELDKISNSTETRVSVIEAATRLGVCTNSVRAMLQQNRATWGIAWVTDPNANKPRWSYHIARSKFDDYLGTTK